MPDRVDAAIQPMKAPRPHAVRDCIATEPQGEQLPNRRHTMLELPQAGERPISCAGFAANIAAYSAHLVHASDGGRALAKDQHVLRQLRNK
jgi:hypothetical protein